MTSFYDSTQSSTVYGVGFVNVTSTTGATNNSSAVLATAAGGPFDRPTSRRNPKLERVRSVNHWELPATEEPSNDQKKGLPQLRKTGKNFFNHPKQSAQVPLLSGQPIAAPSNGPIDPLGLGSKGASPNVSPGLLGAPPAFAKGGEFERKSHYTKEMFTSEPRRESQGACMPSDQSELHSLRNHFNIEVNREKNVRKHMVKDTKSNLNLLFYDFNSGGAKEAPPLLDGSPSELKVPAANPYRNTTSYFFKGGDRLPTRENASRGGADVESRRSIARTKNQLHLES